MPTPFVNCPNPRFYFTDYLRYGGVQNRIACFSRTYVSVQCASQPLNPYFAPFIELHVPYVIALNRIVVRQSPQAAYREKAIAGAGEEVKVNRGKAFRLVFGLAF